MPTTNCLIPTTCVGGVRRGHNGDEPSQRHTSLLDHLGPGEAMTAMMRCFAPMQSAQHDDSEPWSDTRQRQERNALFVPSLRFLTMSFNTTAASSGHGFSVGGSTTEGQMLGRRAIGIGLTNSGDLPTYLHTCLATVPGGQCQWPNTGPSATPAAQRAREPDRLPSLAGPSGLPIAEPVTQSGTVVRGVVKMVVSSSRVSLVDQTQATILYQSNAQYQTPVYRTSVAQ